MFHNHNHPYGGRRFSTGILKLDVALNGGLEPGELVEFYGRPSTGKSIMCQTVLTEFCHNREDGTTALYIDAKNDLVPSRLFDMFKRCPPSMRRVRVVRKSTAEGILEVLRQYEKEIVRGQCQFCENLRLIAVDSLPTILYGSATEDADAWRAEVEKFTAQLKTMASKYGLIILLINHAVGNFYHHPSGDSRNSRNSGPGQESKPALGKHWVHLPHFRFLLTRLYAFGSNFRATLEKASRVTTNQCFDFHITELGVQ